MDQYLSKEKIDGCYGCTACVAICPRHAITMQQDMQGFWRPHIDLTECINCGLCDRICPQNGSVVERENGYPCVYAAKHKSNEVRENSSSGGAFTALSDFVLRKKGVVYGCVYDENMVAKHIRASTAGLRDKCCGSKYVQSELSPDGELFKQVLEDLKCGRMVLFSGTPCQIGGLNNFLSRDYGNLITVDMVCHGVPSPLLFQNHIAWLEALRRKKIVAYYNRSKLQGWGRHIEKVIFQSGKEEFKSVQSQAWKRIFYSHCALRPTCYTCKYASLDRVSDITIADFWGIDEACPGFRDGLGVSLIMLNTEKAVTRKEELLKDMETLKVDSNMYIQPSLNEPVKKPKVYDEFWRIYNEKGYIGVVKQYANCSFSGQIKELIKKIVYHRNYIP